MVVKSKDVLAVVEALDVVPRGRGVRAPASLISKGVHKGSIHLYTWFMMCSPGGTSLWRLGLGCLSVILSKK